MAKRTDETMKVPVVLSPGGTARRIVDLDKYDVPDVWHAAMRIKDKADQELVLEVWHLAHSLRTHILQHPGPGQDKCCTYTKRGADAYGTNWRSDCGHEQRYSAPVEVGFQFDPLPNEDGEFCRYCGRKIVLNKKAKPARRRS